MRQVFTSPRLANVEAVAQLLEDAGIATKISNGRSYRGRFDRGISYREGGGEGNQAAVGGLRSEDQPQARAMLREAGLLDSTRPDRQRDSFLPEHLRVGGAAPVSAKRWLSPGRLKVLLLIGIAFAMALITLWQRRPTSPAAPSQPVSNPAPAVQGPAVLAARTAAPVVQRVDVPSALATLLLGRAAGERGINEACIRIDEEAPSERVVELLAEGGKPKPAEAARCGEGTQLPRIDIDEYMTDGSGVGTVRMRVHQGAMRIDQRFDVERQGHDWRVTGSTRR